VNPIVLGAAGFLGLNLVDALITGGVVPRCGRRRREFVIPLKKRKVPMVIVELDEPEVLASAMEGSDVVFHAAAHYPRYCVDPEPVLELGIRQTRNALDAAARAGVRRFVYVSTTATVAPNPDGPSTEAHVHPAPPGYGLYHDLKWHMEQLVAAEDRFETLIACPAGCIGPWDLRVATSALIVAMARHLDPPHPDGLVNLVDVRDVGTGLVRLAQMDDPPRRVLFCGGTYPLQPMLERLAERYGAPPPSPPLSAEEAVALADAEEARCAAEGGRPAISREIVDLILHSFEIDATLARRVLGMQWTPIDASLDAYDAWARPLGILPP